MLCLQERQTRWIQTKVTTLLSVLNVIVLCQTRSTSMRTMYSTVSVFVDTSGLNKYE